VVTVELSRILPGRLLQWGNISCVSEPGKKCGVHYFEQFVIAFLSVQKLNPSLPSLCHTTLHPVSGSSALKAHIVLATISLPNLNIPHYSTDNANTLSCTLRATIHAHAHSKQSEIKSITFSGSAHPLKDLFPHFNYL